MTDYIHIFGDIGYEVRFHCTNIHGNFITVNSVRSVSGSQRRSFNGFWRVKKLHPTPNKSSVLLLAKTDKLI